MTSKKVRIIILVTIFALCGAVEAGYVAYNLLQDKRTRAIRDELQEMREMPEQSRSTWETDQKAGGAEHGEPGNAAEGAETGRTGGQADAALPDGSDGSETLPQPEILPEYRELYEENQDMIGWLTIDGTRIDYPVMQTMEDECHYLRLDFYGEENRNGCLIMDTDSVVGTGTAADGYAGGTAPSTNLIIHGHTMKSGEMFGTLKLYADETYGKEHNIIHFDSLYEKREYEVMAVFYSRIFYTHETVFKYYNFFQADTQEEFDDWYNNIREMSLYDIGVTAVFGDEFITLSCCSYHVEDGRFVVVGKRTDSPQYQE